LRLVESTLAFFGLLQLRIRHLERRLGCGLPSAHEPQSYRLLGTTRSAIGRSCCSTHPTLRSKDAQAEPRWRMFENSKCRAGDLLVLRTPIDSGQSTATWSREQDKPGFRVPTIPSALAVACNLLKYPARLSQAPTSQRTNKPSKRPRGIRNGRGVSLLCSPVPCNESHECNVQTPAKPTAMTKPRLPVGHAPRSVAPAGEKTEATSEATRRKSHFRKGLGMPGAPAQCVRAGRAHN